MDTRAAAALVHLRVAVRWLKPIRTLAMKSILFIYTCTPISTWARGTLIYFHIALRTSKARFANTVIAVDAIFADPIVTWVTGTVVIVDLTICA